MARIEEREKITGEYITPERIEEFLDNLRRKHRGESSLVNYRRNLTGFYNWLPEDKVIDGEMGNRWRRWMIDEKGFSNRTVNTQVSCLNTFLRYIGHRDWQVDEFVWEGNDVQPELSRAEYLRLLSAAKHMGKERSYLLIKTMGGAGVRVQEMPQMTAEAVNSGSVKLDSHNGQRLRIMRIPAVLREELLDYIRRQKIVSGAVFLARDGKPLSRSAIHHYVNIVSQEAKVEPEKANPRCLWKMYQNTQDGIQASVNVLILQTYEHMMEQEQLSIGWDA